MQTKHIALLAGDGIGAEVTAQAVRVLHWLSGRSVGDDAVTFTFEEALIGGIAYEETGNPLPAHTLEGLQLFLHYPSRKQLPTRVRVWVDFVVEQFGGHPDLSVDPAVWAA